MMNPAPQTPHSVSPENRYCGRLAPPGFVSGSDRMPAEFLALLCIRPKLVGDDAQPEHFLPYPLGLRIEPGYALRQAVTGELRRGAKKTTVDSAFAGAKPGQSSRAEMISFR